MIEVQLRPEGITPTEGIVQRIQDRRDRHRRDQTFPPVPGEKEEEEPPDEEKPQPPRKTEDSDPHRIDIHVLGVVLPTGQLLPPAACDDRLH